jgi:hypothetical protein
VRQRRNEGLLWLVRDLLEKPEKEKQRGSQSDQSGCSPETGAHRRGLHIEKGAGQRTDHRAQGAQARGNKKPEDLLKQKSSAQTVLPEHTTGPISFPLDD